MDLKSTYNTIAKDWDDDHAKDTWWVNGTDKYISFLPKGASILDVGCGAGHKTKYLADKGFVMTGIDFSEKSIEIAQENISEGKFFVKDIREPLGFQENSFDGVFAQAVLLHFPKEEVLAVLKNIILPLKPGGYLQVAVKELRPGEEEEETLKESDYGYDYERFFSYFTIEELKNYLQKIDMEIVYESVTSSGKRSWLQIIGKK